MEYLKSMKCFLVFCFTTVLLSSTGLAADPLPHPDTYFPRASEVHKIKKIVDDPRDLMVTLPPEKALPQAIYGLMTFDVEEAKIKTQEIVGFLSPDLVGNISPEIKPGKYTYKDLEKSPGLKALFPPELLLHIKEGGPPLAGSIPEFEIVPTRQLYWFLNLCKMTNRNLGKTKLDKDGYIVSESWSGGYPFPRPSGPFKAQQIYYDFEKRFETYDFCFATRGESFGLDGNLNLDKYNQYSADFIKFKGRALFPPYGWFDERSEKNGEFRAFASYIYEPRAMRGMSNLNYLYDDPYKLNSWLIYLPGLRRIRKMAATDVQDPMGDMTYDDTNHIMQKITPKRYPYKFEIIAEREYLMPIQYNGASQWIDSKNGYALKETKLMRRPCYVLQMTQLDPNYIYSKRIIYIDKENFQTCLSANYDQRGRLYRSQLYTMTYMPETAMENPYGTYLFQFDHLDRHTTFQMQFYLPAVHSRIDFSMQTMIKKGK